MYAISPNIVMTILSEVWNSNENDLRDKMVHVICLYLSSHLVWYHTIFIIFIIYLLSHTMCSIRWRRGIEIIHVTKCHTFSDKMRYQRPKYQRHGTCVISFWDTMFVITHRMAAIIYDYMARLGTQSTQSLSHDSLFCAM
jgi:hypothetical protein